MSPGRSDSRIIKKKKKTPQMQSQISDENGPRIWMSEVVDQNVQVNRLEGSSQGGGSKM